jgi:uncharacterized protein (TIGR03000 family)
MSCKLFSFGGPLLLAGALTLATSDSAFAQHRGGGHGGGFHAGGFHGHASRGFQGGGFHGGYHHEYLHHGYGSHHHYYPHHGYWGHHHYYPYYRWYGSYYYPYYGYYPSYYDNYPYDWSTPAYDSGYPNYSGSLTPSYSDGDSPPLQPDNTAHITISTPPGATIWFDDHNTAATGSVREFHSPPLTPGNQYAYEVRARWYENGQEVTQTQRVPVTAGAHVRVTFPLEPTKARTAPNH